MVLRPEHDARGNVTSASIPGARWSATYGGSGGVDLLTTLDPLSHSTSLTYGDNAQPHVPTSLLDEAGLAWSATHNAFGQILTATPPTGSPTGTGTVVYDENVNSSSRGYPLYATDGNGDIVTFDGYDLVGDLLQISTYPVHGDTNTRNSTSFIYDAVQRITRVTHPDGKNSQAIYAGHNLSYTLDEANTRYDYTYCAPCGLLASIADPMGWSLGWSYDGDHDLTGFVDARGKVTAYQYGLAGDLYGITYPDNSTLGVRYDQYCRLSSVINGRAAVINLGYYIRGNVNYLGNAINSDPIINYSYQTDGALSSVVDGLGMTNVTYTTRGQVSTVTHNYSSLQAIQTLNYAYNQGWSRASMTWLELT